MNQEYYDTVTSMEKAGIDQQYMDGWMQGYMRDQQIEEQRICEAYEAGYEHGMEKKTDGYSSWAK